MLPLVLRSLTTTTTTLEAVEVIVGMGTVDKGPVGSISSRSRKTVGWGPDSDNNSPGLGNRQCPPLETADREALGSPNSNKMTTETLATEQAGAHPQQVRRRSHRAQDGPAEAAWIPEETMEMEMAAAELDSEQVRQVIANRPHLL